MLISKGIQRDLITATAAIAGIGSIAFGFLTNLPVALAQVLQLSHDLNFI
jgi:AGZA family xanthine/uracil permease-like MFS transporter